MTVATRHRTLWLCTTLTLFLGLLSGLLYSTASASAAPQSFIIVDSFDQEVPFINNGNCTLGEAIHAANTDTAVDDCSAGSGADIIELTGGIPYLLTQVDNACGSPQASTSGCGLPVITSDVTLMSGSGALIFRDIGTPPFRFFRVENGHLKLENILLVNGAATTSGAAGGAIYVSNDGQLTLFNSFINSSSAASHGGAIAAEPNAGVWLGASGFNDNSAIEGGAVSGGLLTIVDSTFANNDASNGSAIFALTTGNTITVTGSSFSQNVSNNSGTIYTCHLLTIDDSTFSNNSVGEHGGAIYYGSGGVCGATRSSDIRNSTFQSNFSGQDGGVLYALSGQHTISGTRIINNQAQGDGGAIFMQPSGTGRLDMVQSQVYSNTAAAGGGLHVSNAETVLLRTTVVSNTATSGNGGGVLKAGRGGLTLTLALVAGNSAESGGALALGNSAENLTLEASTITRNHGRNGTGGLFIADNVVSSVYSMLSSVLADNETAIRVHPDLLFAGSNLSAVLVSDGFNYLGEASTQYTPNPSDVAGSATNMPPQLGRPEPTGYVTGWMMLPLPGSPLIDQIGFTTAACATLANSDLRKLGRPRLFTVTAGQGTCDVGAFERQNFERFNLQFSGLTTIKSENLLVEIAETTDPTPLGSVTIQRNLALPTTTTPEKSVVQVKVFGPSFASVPSPAPFDLTICYTDWELALTPSFDPGQIIILHEVSGDEFIPETHDVATKCVTQTALNQFGSYRLAMSSVPTAVELNVVSAETNPPQIISMFLMLLSVTLWAGVQRKSKHQLHSYTKT